MDHEVEFILLTFCMALCLVVAMLIGLAVLSVRFGDWVWSLPFIGLFIRWLVLLFRRLR